MAKEQTQPVEFLVQAKYRGSIYSAGKKVEVLPADVDDLIADGVIDKDTKPAKVKASKDDGKDEGGTPDGGAAGGDQ